MTYIHNLFKVKSILLQYIVKFYSIIFYFIKAIRHVLKQCLCFEGDNLIFLD